MPNPPTDLSRIEALVEIMRALRAPVGGCPWDLEQTFETIAPYTLEEAFEVADAIDRKDIAALKGELGDLLFQVVYHAQMASETGAFALSDVVEAIASKLVRRHPHVFGEADIKTSAEQSRSWEALKAAERSAAGHTSVLDDVPLALPALQRAEKLQKRMAGIGFDWAEAGPIIAKIREEIDEVAAALETGNPAKVTDEFGDVLFAFVNLGRHLGVQAEEALRLTNAKVERRFRWMERELAALGSSVDAETLETLDGLWQRAKGVVG